MQISYNVMMLDGITHVILSPGGVDFSFKDSGFVKVGYSFFKLEDVSKITGITDYRMDREKAFLKFLGQD